MKVAQDGKSWKCECGHWNGSHKKKCRKCGTWKASKGSLTDRSPEAIAKAEVLAHLETDPRMVTKSLVALYHQQTDDEKAAERTEDLNHRGFNGVDAQIGSSLAKQVLEGRTLTYKQLSVGRKILRKYVGQLVNLVTLEEPETETEEKRHECDGCKGDGIYYGAGKVVNGKFVGVTGTCFRCGGKGYQTDADKKRNWGYDNYGRKFNMGGA